MFHARLFLKVPKEAAEIQKHFLLTLRMVTPLGSR
jgi:hypothetical protein